MNLMGQRLGQYEIIGRFGEGGMATVYRARQLNIKREVAVKVILPSLATKEDFNKRFEQEAQMIASLSNPHIVKVFDYGVLRGFHMRLVDSQADPRKDLYYFVMEMLTGGSLNNRLSRGPLPVDQISSILDQVALALDYAHGRGLVHRDLKPPNVLFDDQNNAFLTDFGIAKLITGEAKSQHLTQEGMTLGTPSYMAPEQWTEDEIDASVDIYALGVVLFEMLTGKLPFVAGTPFRVMHMHLTEPPPSVYSLNPNLPPNLDTVIQTVLAKDPKDRYESGMTLATAFKMALSKGRNTSPISLPVMPPIAPAEPSKAPEPPAPMNTHILQDEHKDTPALELSSTSVMLDRRVLIGGVVALVVMALVIVLLLATRTG